MGTDKSTASDISTMELGNSISSRTRSPLQVLHRLLGLRVTLHGTNISCAHAHALSVWISKNCSFDVSHYILLHFFNLIMWKFLTFRWHSSTIVGYSLSMMFLIVLIPLTWMHFAWNRCKDPHDEHEGHVPHPRNKLLYFFYQTSVKVWIYTYIHYNLCFSINFKLFLIVFCNIT